jgi:protein TonB
LKAIKARAQGTTRLLFTVDATGKLVDARIVGSAGDTPAHQSLDRAALDALSTCPTTPGTDAQGQPVLTRLLIMYIWKIA